MLRWVGEVRCGLGTRPKSRLPQALQYAQLAADNEDATWPSLPMATDLDDGSAIMEKPLEVSDMLSAVVVKVERLRSEL